ncbi:MAG: 16S rRNA (cytosine(1402)-N(4))-methyltransferase RsmH [Methanosarcinaceae archaeon]
MDYKHIPVMLNEVIKYLKIKIGGKYIDCTFGGGGYTFKIIEKIGKNGEIVAIDMDEMAIKNAKIQINKKKIKNIALIHDNFKNLEQVIKKKYNDIKIFDGIVLDLGLSSAQLEDRNRGFSFKSDTPLNMSFGNNVLDAKIQTTEYIVNNLKQEELCRIFRKYGDERFAKRIAQNICEERKINIIKTTDSLVKIIKSAIPKKFQKNRIHPATKVFQALRIATNNELNNLEEVLPIAIKILKKGGRIVVISYHSLEDRIVKHFFKREIKNCLCPPIIPECRCEHKAQIKLILKNRKKLILPSEKEIINNTRARSAKMRVAEKL